MKVLITGIGGFVGRYLMEALLNKGFEVHGTLLPDDSFSNPQVSLHTMDLTNRKQVLEVIHKIKPDQIFHLAGQSSVALSWKEPGLTVMINVVGTIYLLDAVRECNPSAKILLIGSSDQYGIVKPEDCPLKEENFLNPQSPYATSKNAQEQIAKQYVNAFNMNIVMVRAFNHIGPGQKQGFVIADFASQVAEIEKGLKEAVIKVGNLDAKRDFSDVRDVVAAYHLLMECGCSGEVYNVGSGEARSIGVLLEKLISLSTVRIDVKEDPNKLRPIDVPLIICDNRRLKTATSWLPKHPLEDTLKETLDYWRSL